MNRYLKNLLQTKNIFARRDSFENVTEVWQKDYAKEAKDAKVEIDSKEDFKNLE